MEESRRSLVSWLLGGGITASLVSFLFPALRFMNPPEAAEPAVHEAAAGKIDEFPVNSGKIIRFGNQPVLLLRPEEQDWRAFFGTCTHLNCTVQYQESSRQIWCACHNGLFDLNGRVVSGPPPRALEQLEVKIRGDDVIVSRQS